jgi:aminoglycoside 2'-N-acetyltransferase I
MSEAYDLGALGATDEAAEFYATRGWKLWQGPASALTPTGVTRTAEDDGCIFVLPLAAPLDLSSDLTCDWRDGDLW